MKLIHKRFLVLCGLMVCLSHWQETFGADYAVTFYSADPTGIPDGWPATRRELAEGEQPVEGESLVSEEVLAKIMSDRAAAMDARNKRMLLARVAPDAVAEQLRGKLVLQGFQALRIDALQSEIISLLVKSYVRHMRLLELVTKAVAGTSATNNLTAGERTLVQSIRSEPSMGDGTAVTAADVARFVDIRDNTLTPHYQLYLAAKAIVDAWKTNAANAPDPYSPTNLPAVTIGE